MSYKAADSKREEFRKYLEKAGVMDVLTKVLVGLYEEPEKPNNAVDFLKQHLGVDPPETADVEALKMEVDELRERVEKLTEENTELKQKVKELEFNSAAAAASPAAPAAEPQQPAAQSQPASS